MTETPDVFISVLDVPGIHVENSCPETRAPVAVRLLHQMASSGGVHGRGSERMPGVGCRTGRGGCVKILGLWGSLVELVVQAVVVEVGVRCRPPPEDEVDRAHWPCRRCRRRWWSPGWTVLLDGFQAGGLAAHADVAVVAAHGERTLDNRGRAPRSRPGRPGTGRTDGSHASRIPRSEPFPVMEELRASWCIWTTTQSIVRSALARTRSSQAV